MTALPNTLALAAIVDDSNIVAADHRNNYAAIQTAINTLIAALSGGSTGQILEAIDNTDIAWGNGLTRLYDSTLSGTAPSFDITNITASYTNLKLVLDVRGTNASTGVSALITLNNDSGSNYDRQALYSNAGSTAANELFAQLSFDPTLGAVAAASAGTGLFGSLVLEIPNYAGTTANKSMHGDFMGKIGTSSGNLYVAKMDAFWRSTAAVNRITITPSAGLWAVGSRCTLWGYP